MFVYKLQLVLFQPLNIFFVHSTVGVHGRACLGWTTALVSFLPRHFWFFKSLTKVNGNGWRKCLTVHGQWGSIKWLVLRFEKLLYVFQVTVYGVPVCDMDSLHKKPFESLMIGRYGSPPQQQHTIPEDKVLMSVPCVIHSYKPPLHGQNTYTYVLMFHLVMLLNWRANPVNSCCFQVYRLDILNHQSIA